MGYTYSPQFETFSADMAAIASGIVLFRYIWRVIFHFLANNRAKNVASILFYTILKLSMKIRLWGIGSPFNPLQH